AALAGFRLAPDTTLAPRRLDHLINAEEARPVRPTAHVPDRGRCTPTGTPWHDGGESGPSLRKINMGRAKMNLNKAFSVLKHRGGLYVAPCDRGCGYHADDCIGRADRCAADQGRSIDLRRVGRLRADHRLTEGRILHIRAGPAGAAGGLRRLDHEVRA